MTWEQEWREALSARPPEDTSEARQALLLAVLAATEYIEALETRVAELEGRR